MDKKKHALFKDGPLDFQIWTITFLFNFTVKGSTALFYFSPTTSVFPKTYHVLLTKHK